MPTTARSPATAVVEITMEKNANTPMKGVTGVTRPDTLLGCAEQNRTQGTTVSDGDEPDDDETFTLHGVYSADIDINDVSGCKGINVKVTLGSEIGPMQLDTGAADSINAEGTYRSIRSK